MPKNRLLVIDDDDAILTAVARVGRLQGYEVTTASQADEFRERHETWHPTHIIMDLQMPGMDGVELIRFLASENSRARIIIMSGFDAKVLESARRLASERGLDMAGTLRKPFHIADLQKLLADSKEEAAQIDEKALADAIENHEMVLTYQPKIKLDTKGATRFEALVRWIHPSLGIVMPDKFIALAEDSGQVTALTREVARMAFSQLAEWRDAGITNELSINISGRDLADVRFADELHELSARFAITPGLVTLELTESSAASNAADAIDILTRLRLMGFSISIDDFGTGYSSLVQLHRLPFSELKIDREFVRDCADSGENQVIVKTMIDLAHNLNLSVVAEGVEDAAVAAALEGLGCDYAQGYFFSRPLAVEQVVEWTKNWADGNAAKRIA
jgi:EAL domain-containing protein (putative c-di-GMP-specific phosphodiesterase class I)